MAYDHNEKAGNQGDLIKHIVLLTAVDSILATGKYSSTRPFRYCDTFAGYAFSPVLKGNEWKNGIGQLFDRREPDKPAILDEHLAGNEHVDLYCDFYFGKRPSFVGKTYPGSSLIVHDLCIRHGVKPEFSLWDISPGPIANLMATYNGLGHRIHTSPAVHDTAEVIDADLVFIDPPKAPIKRDGALCWDDMIQFLKPHHENFIFWLPIDFRKKDGEMIENTERQREDALSKGLDVLVARWKPDENSIKTVGCQMFYRLDDSTKVNIESAVRHINRTLSWSLTFQRGS